jgi:hypothetical protein
MNYYAILKKHYDGKIWGIAEDYTTLDWGDEMKHLNLLMKSL